MNPEQCPLPTAWINKLPEGTVIVKQTDHWLVCCALLAIRDQNLYDCVEEYLRRLNLL